MTGTLLPNLVTTAQDHPTIASPARKSHFRASHDSPLAAATRSRQVTVAMGKTSGAFENSKKAAGNAKKAEAAAQKAAAEQARREAEEADQWSKGAKGNAKK